MYTPDPSSDIFANLYVPEWIHTTARHVRGSAEDTIKPCQPFSVADPSWSGFTI
ncbi:hypothetical protein CCM_02329 [Cordyceps militaris CM01]|uniref:Uncharacterized protein n=1 Tax=Cordyceps militaris (strain CM01) TaxID=983644 RepID=G3J926_CORMM|nr:uncharacterized protein CCM_02329 [Cordyceps militaris CM01]EGX94058.1 hypothetical protein CCM_02329 [Cordyceps militaris CM01]